MKSMLHSFIIMAFLFGSFTTKGQQMDEAKHSAADTAIRLIPNEFWWGGTVTFGDKMPMGKEKISFNLNGGNAVTNGTDDLLNPNKWIITSERLSICI